MIIIALVFGVGGYLTGSNKNKDKKEEPKEKEVTNCLEAVDEPTKKVENDYINKTFTKTYNINHIAPSNNFDYIYITIIYYCFFTFIISFYIIISKYK